MNRDLLGYVTSHYHRINRLRELDSPFFASDLPDGYSIRRLHIKDVIEVTDRVHNGGSWRNKWQLSPEAERFLERYDAPSGGPLPCEHGGVSNIMDEPGPHDYQCPACEARYTREEVRG